MNEPVGRGERAYRALLRLYPRRFLEEYEGELFEMFRLRRDQRLAAKGTLGLGFWRFVLVDLIGSAWRERRRPLNPKNSSSGGMMGWMGDLGYAARRLTRSPGFSVVALSVLVLGVGVNTLTFSVVNALLFQPPPFTEPDRIVALLQDSDDGRPNSTSFPAFEDIARTEGLFEAVTAFSTSESFLGQNDDLTSVRVEYATSGYLEVLGLTPTRGRWFDAPEDDADGPPAAVVTHRWWRDRMASDPDVVGTTLRVSGSAVTVVGVGPAEFNGGQGPLPADLWLSVSAMRATGGPAASLTRREDHPFMVRARMAPGVTIQEVRPVMDRLAEELAATYPTLNEGRRLHVIPTEGARIVPGDGAQVAPAAALVMVVSGLVLLIATLNLANLLLVRTTARAREMAVRLAVGAGRWHLIRVVLSEALLLSLLGGAGGLICAAVAVRLIERLPLQAPFPVVLDIRMDASVVLFALGASLVTGLVFGLVPALRATSRDANATLRDESVSTIGAKRRFGLTGAMVAGQVAVSLVLLSVGGVFLESLVAAREADPGFDYQTTGFVQVSLQPLEVAPLEAATLYARIDEVAEGLPMIDRATLSAQLPAAQFGTTTTLLGSGRGGVDTPTEIPWNLVGVDFFDVMGLPLLHGRQFESGDATGAPVVVVSESLARAYWGRSDIVGELLRSESDPESPSEIVGVVADAPVRAVGEDPTPSLYWPYGGGMAARGNILIAASGPVAPALAALRAAIRQVDPRIMILRSASLEEHLGDTLMRQRLAVGTLASMGGLALLLALLGVYGLVSFSVTRRRREVGVRMALGAGVGSVLGLFLRDVATVVGVGVVVGLAAAIPLVQFIGRSFVERDASVAVTLAFALALVGTAVLATLVPASRALRTDPRDALTWD